MKGRVQQLNHSMCFACDCVEPIHPLLKLLGRAVPWSTFYQVREVFTWDIINLNDKSWKAPGKPQEILCFCSMYLITKKKKKKKKI